MNIKVSYAFGVAASIMFGSIAGADHMVKQEDEFLLSDHIYLGAASCNGDTYHIYQRDDESVTVGYVYNGAVLVNERYTGEAAERLKRSSAEVCYFKGVQDIIYKQREPQWYP